MTTRLDIEKERHLRKQFEEDYAAAQMPAEADWFKLDGDGDYVHSHTASAWEGYQMGIAARRASLQADEGKDAGAIALLLRIWQNPENVAHKSSLLYEDLRKFIVAIAAKEGK